MESREEEEEERERAPRWPLASRRGVGRKTREEILLFLNWATRREEGDDGTDACLSLTGGPSGRVNCRQ